MATKPVTPTPFGKFTRTLRIHRDEYMKDMAAILDVTPGALSAAETGRRNVPKQWASVLIEHYGLTPSEATELKQAIWDSRSYENLNIVELSFEDRRLLRGISELLPTLDANDERRKAMCEWIKDMPVPDGF